MPLTALQKDVLTVLAANCSEESRFAGGVVLNAADDSVRFSHDIDIFHELASNYTNVILSLPSAGRPAARKRK
jgi:hypothetical protein